MRREKPLNPPSLGIPGERLPYSTSSYSHLGNINEKAKKERCFILQEREKRRREGKKDDDSKMTGMDTTVDDDRSRRWNNTLHILLIIIYK